MRIRCIGDIMKFVKWLLKSLVFGLVTIFVFNIVGVYLNLNIPVNALTILTISLLRIPGLAMLVILLNFF